jgi:phage-related protein
MQSLAGVGGAIEPIITDIKLMGASLLSEAVPGVQALAEAFRGMMNGEEGAAGDFAAAISGMVSGLVGKITEALPGIAQVGLSIITTLATSLAQQLPTLLTTGGQIVSQLLNGIATNLPNIAQGALNAIGGFVQGLQTNLPLVLAKGREILMNLATGIKENLPSLVSQGLDIIMNFAQTIYDNAPSLIQTGFDVLSNLVAGIMSSLPTLIAKVPEIISTFANTINHNFPTILKKGAELVLQIVKGLLSAIPTLIANIPKIITAIVDVWQAFNWLQLGKNVITFLKNGITSMLGAIKGAGTNVHNAVVNAIKSLPSKLLQLGKNALEFLKNAINGARGAVASAGGNILNAVVNAIKSMPSKLLSMGKDAISKLGSAIGSGASAIKSKAVSIVNSVIDTFKSVPSKMVSIGKDIINGVISGITAMVGKLYESIKNALSGLVEKGKKALGIASPSKVMAKEIGQHIPTGAAVGIDKNTKIAERSMVDMADEMVAAANAELAGASLTAPGFNGLTFERNLQHRPAAAQTAAAPYMGIGDKLDAILAAIEKGQILTIDKKLLVGGTANDYDSTLGQLRALVARGAL